MTVSNSAGIVTATAVLTVNPLAITLPNGSLPLAMKPISSGSFTMGDDDIAPPAHSGTLSQNFYMGTYLVTQAQWLAVMGNNPSQFTGDAQRPVEQVSWDDCQSFCKQLNARFAALGARLPTEAEWEYACRAGTTSAYNDGSTCTKPDGHDPALEKLGWFDKNSDNTTHPVGEKQPNKWGLHDLHGNVFELCSDWFGDYSETEQHDPKGPIEGRGRVIRGGGWSGRAQLCRSAYRSRVGPGFRRNFLGFRLAAVQSGEPSKYK